MDSKPLPAEASAKAGQTRDSTLAAPAAPLGAAPEPPLTTRVVKGVAWVFAGKVVGRGTQLVKLVVLARLLTPEDFGLFGIVMLAIATVNTFTQTGFNTALIQRKDNIEDYLDTAWTVQVIRGLVLAAMLFAIAPVVGWFFEEPRAVPLLRVMCISVALGGFVNIGIIYFRKELEFHKQFVYNLVPAVLSLVVGVILAYRLRSVWALVWAGMATAATRCILSYVIHAYRPRGRFDWPRAAELFRFGRWMLAISVVQFLAMHGDRVVLAKLLGASVLGAYSLAFTFAGLPASEIRSLTDVVMMPAYAKVQHRKRKLGRGFLDVFELVLSLALPLAVFMVLAAPEIVLGVLGPKWGRAIGPLRILAVAGLFRAVIGTSGPLFVGTGHPHLQFYKSITRAVVTLGTIYPLTMLWGAEGTAVAALLGVAALTPMFFWVVQISGVQVTQIAGRSVPGVVLSACVLVAVLAGKLLPAFHAMVELVLLLALCGLLTSVAVLGMGIFQNRGPYYLGVRAWATLRR